MEQYSLATMVGIVLHDMPDYPADRALAATQLDDLFGIEPFERLPTSSSNFVVEIQVPPDRLGVGVCPLAFVDVGFVDPE